jgi:nucleoside-triphosphatase THEP1
VSSILAWLFSLTAIGLVFFDRPDAQLVALAAAAAAALVRDRRVLGAILRLGVILTILFSTAVIGAVVASARDWTTGLQLATAMLLRLLVLIILAALLARNVDAEALLRVTRRLGLQRLGLILGLALNVLPHLTDAARQVVVAWRVRRGSGAARAPSPMALIEVLLAHVARIADEAAAAAALRGHSVLLQAPVRVSTATPVIVATGAPGTGKTSVALSVARRLQSKGWPVVGFVQPARFDDGDKVGFGVRDLVTDEESDLARLVSRSEGDHGTRYRFINDGFAHADRAVARVGRGDLLIVDELGPLELRGEGHMRAVQRALSTPGLRGIVLVVRAQLVPALLAALEADDAVVVDSTAPDGESELRSVIEHRCRP